MIKNNGQEKVWFLRVSDTEKIILARQLALMLRSGLSIIDSFEFLKEQTRSKTLKYIFENIINDFQKGIFLATSLKRFKKVFGDFFINIVEVGEASGNLDKNLDYLANSLEKQRELKGKVISAFIYPAFVLAGTLGVSLIIIFVIFPKILPIFTELKVKLPLTTIIFIKISNFILNFWPLIIAYLISLIIITILLLRIDKIRYFFDKLIITIPIFRTIIRDSIFVIFSRNLALLLESGLDISRSLEFVATTINNKFYRNIFMEALVAIRQGHPFKEFLHRKSKYFDNVFINLLEIGEKTGSLQRNLFYLADYFEADLTTRLKNLTTILEPVLLIFMGIIVGFIALSIVIPIYELSDKLQK
jgi:type II secretory pathway component PulF